VPSEEARREQAEYEYLERVAHEITLPAHRPFDDYLILTMQFGYCVMWSTCWPLAPAMALINIMIRLRTDALKILTVYKRPVPSHAAGDTVRVWINALSIITWLGAITNTLLCVFLEPFLLHQRTHSHHTNASPSETTRGKRTIPSVDIAFIISSTSSVPVIDTLHSGIQAIVPGLVILLLASSTMLAVRRYVRHVFQAVRTADIAVLGVDHQPTLGLDAQSGEVEEELNSPTFWVEDQGEAEIMNKSH